MCVKYIIGLEEGPSATGEEDIPRDFLNGRAKIRREKKFKARQLCC